MLTVAVARPHLTRNTVCYVLPVLRMTSRFNTITEAYHAYGAWRRQY